MKIGILTFYRVPNYGAMLQAYALWHYLEERGHEVVFIDYAFGNARRIPLWRCLVSRSLRSLRNKLIQRAEFGITAFAARFPRTRPYADHASLLAAPPPCDAYIVGSDQMWNPKWCIPCLETVFLDFAPANVLRVSYAASFGQDFWGDAARDRLKRLLRRFAAVSVREKSGVAIVRDAAGVPAAALPDPTLLMPSGFYRGLLPAPPARRPGGKKLFAYILREWESGTPYESGAVRECRRAVAADTVKTCFRRPPGPAGGLLARFGVLAKESVEEFLADFETSDFVITNSFHGTVFSLIFHRPFLTLSLMGDAASMNDRVASLLEAAGLEERLITPASAGNIPALAAKAIDWGAVDRALADGRARAGRFFDGIERGRMAHS